MNNQKETPEEWLKRHSEHCWEEFTPDRPFETRFLHCHDCNEDAIWKGKKKLIDEY